MSTEIIQTGETAVARSASPFDGNVAEFKGALARRGENRKTFIDWIRDSLTEGVDFGRIHVKKKSECQHRGPPKCTPELEPYHWSKPTLFKPGAEKICGMLGVIPTFPTLKDYEQAALNGVPIGQIILRCDLLSAAGDVMANGVGARSVEQDYGNLNTSLKMAQKSGHIDATLRMAGLSEIFTQDIEDIIDKEKGGGDLLGTSAERQQRPAGKPPTQAPRSTGGRGFATEKQVLLLQRRCDDAGVDAREVCEQFAVDSLAQVPFGQVNEVLAWIAEAHA